LCVVLGGVSGECSEGCCITPAAMTARVLLRRRRHPAAEAGFLLPLALSASLLLLLSSLSLQLAVLHSRRLQQAAAATVQSDDALLSAAHQLTAALQGPYRCLRAWPSAAWRAGALPLECPPGLDLAPLLEPRQQEQTVRLSSWQPSADGGLLELQLGDTGPLRRYALTLAPLPLLREVG
jgi:hypothetical protein